MGGNLFTILVLCSCKMPGLISLGFPCRLMYILSNFEQTTNEVNSKKSSFGTFVASFFKH